MGSELKLEKNIFDKRDFLSNQNYLLDEFRGLIPLPNPSFLWRSGMDSELSSRVTLTRLPFSWCFGVDGLVGLFGGSMRSPVKCLVDMLWASFAPLSSLAFFRGALNFIYLFLMFLAATQGLQDLIFLARDWTQAPGYENAQS